MALGIVKYAYDHSSQLIDVIWFAVSCCGPMSLWGPISASLRSGNAAPFKVMLQQWQAVGNTVSELTCLTFEPPTPETNALPLDQFAYYTVLGLSMILTNNSVKENNLLMIIVFFTLLQKT